MPAMKTPFFSSRPHHTAEFLGSATGGPDDKPGKPGDQAGVMLKPRTQPRRPSLYRVALMNDDFTPMEFVITVLEQFFGKTRAEATDIMLHVHRRGVGICGIYTYEVAETKVAQVLSFAKANEQPLQCIMERE
jgi:ATP-dependent Clp protease adaptor protein ClpS